MLYEVITNVRELSLKIDHEDLIRVQALAEAYGLTVDEIGSQLLRITSYNVCYTKLLRLHQDSVNIGVVVQARQRGNQLARGNVRSKRVHF